MTFIRFRIPSARTGGSSAPSFPRWPRTRGFALMVALLLLGFIMLLLVSLTALTSVEITTSANQSDQERARLNALFGLSVALGQLQQNAGADQRVTASADLQPVSRGQKNDPASDKALTGNDPTAIFTEIDSFWQQNGRQRHWTGVWKDPDPGRSTYNGQNADATIVEPELVGWLVSGNETDGDRFKPQDDVRALSAEDLRSVQKAVRSGSSQPYRILVGTGTVNVADPSQLDRIVLAPQVEIAASGKAEDKIGSYAYWVGDEGVKTNALIIDPYARNFPDANPRKRLLSAQRPAVETLANALAPFTDILDYNSGEAMIRNARSAIHFDQLQLLAPDNAAFAAALKDNYHNLTVQSLGVLSDTRHGGLRHDLSMLFGQPTVDAFNTHLAKIYNLDATDKPASKPILLTRKPSSASSSAPPVPTVYARYPSAFSGNAAQKRNYTTLLDYSATWGQLYSHYNMGNAETEGGVMTGSGAAHTRAHTDTTAGIGPLLTQAKLFFGMEVKPDGAIELKLRPLVVLANPYSVPLSGTWWVTMEPSELRLAYNLPEPAPPVDPNEPTAESFDLVNLVSLETGSSKPRISERMLLRIANVTLEPGRAYVFTLNANTSDSGNPSTPIPILEMVNDFDENTTFTFPTGHNVDTGKGYVALYAKSTRLAARLYTGTNQPSKDRAASDSVMLHYVYPKNAGLQVPQDAFLVYPVSTGGGSREGGGMWMTVNDPFANRLQQAPFLNVNYAARMIYYTGFSGENDHPLEWAQTYVRRGNQVNISNGFKEDVLFAPDSTAEVHWGLANRGKEGASTVHPAGIADQQMQMIFYEVPSATTPLNSLGQLQHFNTTGFIKPNERWDSTGDWTKQYPTMANSLQNNYLISNSYPNVRVGRHQLVNADGQKNGSIGPHYDGSWLMNEVLWDRFFFSTYPQSGTFDFDTGNLLNHRYRPFRHAEATPSADSYRSTSTAAAENLLTEGAFNINSTSPAAWKALLTYAKNLAMDSASADNSVHVPFARFSYPAGGSTNSRDGVSENAWNGFHNLSESEIEALADAIVLQVRRRGPFTSLSDFVNRRLIKTSSDALDTGLSGAIQAALDTVINSKDNIQLSALKANIEQKGSNNGIAENAFLPKTRVAGFPGYVLQADILTPLAPVLSARSDTFVIRAYGNALANDKQTELAHAWCEAVVQRLPDYVDDRDSAGKDPASLLPLNTRLGRKFQIVSFRWLSPDEV